MDDPTFAGRVIAVAGIAHTKAAKSAKVGRGIQGGGMSRYKKELF